jgi:hypothetical protein
VSICSVESASVGEQLAGTAPFARAWIVIEQPGPWGREAVAESKLPPPVRENLARAKAAGVSVVLARHPDRPERAGFGEVNVWVARVAAGGMLLRHGLMADLTPLAAWDLDRLAAGSLPALGSVTQEPLLLVCTHGRRDRCCAVHGRALLTSLLETATPEQRRRVWECSHVGGHRFAPVTVSLPSGAVHGRLDDTAAAQVLAALDHGRVVVDNLRGRSGFLPPCQAAAGAVRRLESIDGVDDLDVLAIVDGRAVPPAAGLPADGVTEAEVRHRDGRAWRVDLTVATLPELRAESCGAEPGPVRYWTAQAPRPVTPWH